MKITIKTLIVVLLTLMSVSAAQAYECVNTFPLTGLVCNIQYATPDEPSKIWIAPDGNCNFDDPNSDIYEIIGFPFGNLTLQLSNYLDDEVEIGPGDCVSIYYTVKTSKWDSDVEYDKWCTLVVFCDDCNISDCESCPAENADDCFDANETDNSNMVRKPLRHGPPNKEHPGKPPWKQSQEEPQP